MLTDTVDRFRIDQALQDFIDQMNSDDPAIYRRADAQSQLHLLANLELWPKAKTLRFLDSNGRTAWELPGEKNASVVQIHEAQLKQDVVLETLLEALDEPQRKTLLGEAFGDPVTSLKNRALKLRKQLAGRAQSHRAELFDTRYQQLERPITPRQRAMIDNTPGLPLTAADALLDTANSQELKAVDEGKIPVRLSELAQSLRDEARVNHAYDGLYLDSTETLDTHRLALHSLEKLPGWAGKSCALRSEAPRPRPPSWMPSANRRHASNEPWSVRPTGVTPRKTTAANCPARPTCTTRCCRPSPMPSATPWACTSAKAPL